MYTVTMICLANSRKPPSGRCIAGKIFNGKSASHWIRPVSARPTREVSEEERRYEGGTKVQLLDIVTVPLVQASQLGHQAENHILDDGYYWTKNGVATWSQVRSAVDTPSQDFWANSQSTFHGHNDKVAESALASVKESLQLILVDKVQIRVRMESGYEGNPGRRRVRARFDLGGNGYLLSVTDPEIEDHYLTKGDGDYELGPAALCISLAEVWNGFAFRVVASVITPERCGSTE